MSERRTWQRCEGEEQGEQKEQLGLATHKGAHGAVVMRQSRTESDTGRESERRRVRGEGERRQTHSSALKSFSAEPCFASTCSNSRCNDSARPTCFSSHRAR